MTDSPSVTWPSPARTTLPLRRMDKTVVDRISRFVDMGAILDYSSVEGAANAGAKNRWRPISVSLDLFGSAPGFQRRKNVSLEFLQKLDVEFCWEGRFRKIRIIGECVVVSSL